MSIPIDLYYWPTPNGWKVSITLEEMGLAYNTHLINIGAGDQFQPDFLQISPNNRMPAIVDREGPDGAEIAIFESGAILQYLARKSGLFYGETARDHIAVDQWLMWQMGGMGPMLGQFGHFYKFAADKTSDDYAKDRYTAEARRLLGVLDKHLDGKDYVAAGEYTIADMAIWPWYGNLVLGNLYDAAEFLQVDSYTNVVRWAKMLEAREAVQRGKIVNRGWGEEWEQVPERHSAVDIDEVLKKKPK